MKRDKKDKITVREHPRVKELYHEIIENESYSDEGYYLLREIINQLSERLQKPPEYFATKVQAIGGDSLDLTQDGKGLIRKLARLLFQAERQENTHFLGVDIFNKATDLVDTLVAMNRNNPEPDEQQL